MTDGNNEDDKNVIPQGKDETYGNTLNEETRFENEITEVPWWNCDDHSTTSCVSPQAVDSKQRADGRFISPAATSDRQLC